MTENLFSAVRAHVLTALLELVPDLPAPLVERVEVSPTRDPTHGDMATNAALIAAKPARKAPAALAAGLAERLRSLPDVASATPAGPGFVNITLAPQAWRATLPVILRAGSSYGDSTVGRGVKVNVEYVSANPTGPMHIGHCRGAVLGDALASLLAKAGYEVTREYYINDAGAQVAALAWASYWRYLQAIGTSLNEESFAAAVPGGLQYKGEYLIPVGEALAAQYGDKLAGPNATIADIALWFDIVRAFAIDEMMRSVREDLAALGVAPDVFTSERSLVAAGAVDQAIARLAADGLIYEGVLEPPKGKTPDDWEPREQTLFRATQFGDDVDRPLRRSDGANTYFANDIAYHADKLQRGYDVLIDVWGADHGGYVPRMQAAVHALAGNRQPLEVLLCQIVHVIKDGKPVRMSKRLGIYITLRDLIDEVGRDAVRFTMLTRKGDAQMDFDINQVVAQTRENPVFYVQYAHARCRSVLRMAAEQYQQEPVTDAEWLASVALDSLEDPAELTLIRRLASWPRTVEAAALHREPHRIAFFLYDLAGDFHMLWNRGRDDAALRFLQADQTAEHVCSPGSGCRDGLGDPLGLGSDGGDPSRGVTLIVQDAFDPHLGVGVPPPGYRSIRQREAARAGTRRLVVVAGVLGVGLVSAGAALEYSSHRSHAIPVIEADSRPLRVKPQNPGGMQIAGAGESILSGADTSQTPETLAPPPEAPDPGRLRQQEQAALAREAAPPPKVGDTSQALNTSGLKTTGAVALNMPQPADTAPAASVPTQAQAPEASRPSALTIRPLTPPAPVPALPAPSPPTPITAPRIAQPAVPAAPPTKVAKAPAALPATPTAGRQAQLAAVSSQAAAEAEWQRLAHLLPDLLGSRHPEFSHVTHEGRVYWRLRTGGFADAASVSAFCDEIRAKGFSCTPASF